MSQVEVVALWAGLLGSVVGIVLSVVAIVFTWVVNKRSDKVSDHTIQSLQKIESTVASLSENTTGLIKAAWEKMLGNVGEVRDETIPASSTKELAAGIAAELRAELTPAASSTEARSPERLAQIEQAIERLERTLRAQVPTRVRSDNAGNAIDVMLPRLKAISGPAREYLYQLRERHVTLAQYRELMKDPANQRVMFELRENGLLVPYQGIENDKKVPVYWLAEGAQRVIEPAAMLLPPNTGEVRDRVSAALKAVGYKPSTSLPAERS